MLRQSGEPLHGGELPRAAVREVVLESDDRPFGAEAKHGREFRSCAVLPRGRPDAVEQRLKRGDPLASSGGNADRATGGLELGLERHRGGQLLPCPERGSDDRVQHAVDIDQQQRRRHRSGVFVAERHQEGPPSVDADERAEWPDPDRMRQEPVGILVAQGPLPALPNQVDRFACACPSLHQDARHDQSRAVHPGLAVDVDRRAGAQTDVDEAGNRVEDRGRRDRTVLDGPVDQHTVPWHRSCGRLRGQGHDHGRTEVERIVGFRVRPDVQPGYDRVKREGDEVLPPGG